MRSLNEHLGVIFPLLAFLISFEFFYLSTKMKEHYADYINNEYSIIVAANKELDITYFSTKVDNIKSFDLLDSSVFIDELKNEVSEANLALLKISLPKFYKLNLSSLPSTKDIEQIREKLLLDGAVISVETFKKNHDNVYRLFEFVSMQTQIFFSLIVAISFMLIIKQSTLWQHKHSQRVRVLELFGAPSWMRIGVLIKNAFIDSIIASIIAIIIVYAILYSQQMVDIFTSIYFDQSSINLPMQFLYFIYISFGVNSISLILAILRLRG